MVRYLLTIACITPLLYTSPTPDYTSCVYSLNARANYRECLAGELVWLAWNFARKERQEEPTHCKLPLYSQLFNTGFMNCYIILQDWRAMECGLPFSCWSQETLLIWRVSAFHVQVPLCIINHAHIRMSNIHEYWSSLLHLYWRPERVSVRQQYITHIPPHTYHSSGWPGRFRRGGRCGRKQQESRPSPGLTAGWKLRPSDHQTLP